MIKAENELIKTHLLSDLQNNENNIKEINILKKDYDTKIHELKQGFRDKLSQINEMKKRWVIEEEEKRGKLKVSNNLRIFFIRIVEINLAFSEPSLCDQSQLEVHIAIVTFWIV